MIKFSYLIFAVFCFIGCNSTLEKPKEYTVEIKDMKFVPDDITIKKGDTILWVNRDMIDHNVTEEGTKAWSSSPIPPGKSWKMAMTTGSKYYCSIHMVMKGRIRVQ